MQGPLRPVRSTDRTVPASPPKLASHAAAKLKDSHPKGWPEPGECPREHSLKVFFSLLLVAAPPRRLLRGQGFALPGRLEASRGLILGAPRPPPRQQWLAASRCMCSLQRTAEGPTVPVTTTAAFQVFRHTPLQAPCNGPQQSPLSCQADTGSASSRAGRPLGPLAVPSQRPPGAHMSKHRITYILSMAFDGPSRRSRATKKLSLALTLVSQKLVPERIISSTPEALAGLEARIVWRLSSAWPSGTPAQAARAAQACTARSTI